MCTDTVSAAPNKAKGQSGPDWAANSFVIGENMGKGDDFAGVGVPVKRGRGRPPMKNQQWVQWSAAIQGRVQRYGTVNVYLADGTLAVRADVPKSQLVPAGAKFVGRYQKPFMAKAFYLDMQRLVMGAAGHPQPDVPRNEDFPGREAMICRIRAYLCMMRRPGCCLR